MTVKELAEKLGAEIITGLWAELKWTMYGLQLWEI